MNYEAILNLIHEHTKMHATGRAEGVREVLNSIEQVLSFKISAVEKIRLIELYVQNSKQKPKQEND